MTYDDIIRFYRTQANAARCLRVTRQRLNHWRVKGIAYETQCMIQVRSEGALVASEKGAPEPSTPGNFYGELPAEESLEELIARLSAAV